MTPEDRERRLDLLEHAPCAFHSIGPDGVIREVNAIWLRWLGYTRDEVEAKLPLQAVLTEAAQAIFTLQFPAALREGRLDDLELMMRRKDGTTFPVLMNASAAHDAAGNLLWSRAGFVDITRRKRAEEHNQRLIDAAPDPTVVVDANGEIEFANLQVERAFGYTQSELIGQPVELLVPEGSRTVHVGHRTAFMSSSQVRPMGAGLDLYGRRKDASRFPIEISLSPFDSADGRHVVAAIRDISERVRAQTAAKIASERLADAVESIDDAFAIFDADRVLVMHNSAFRVLYDGVIAGPLIGRYARELALTVADTEPLDLADTDLIAGSLAPLGPPRIIQGFERLGRVYHVATRLTRDGGAVLVLSDRSEERRREEDLRKASAAKSDFLSSMSHELRTPLNAVLGFAQLLQRDRKTPLTPRQTGMVGHISNAGEHLLRLIDDVLDLARIEDGRLMMSLEPTDLAEIAAQVMTTLAPMAARAEIELLVTPELAAVGHVLADRTRLAQTLLNFGSNAIKYGKKGGRATLTASRLSPDRVRLTVIDDGIGISAARQDRVFQPFYRAGQESGPVEGTGIGLAITRRLVELMGGSVGFHSSPGEGSEFWAELAAVTPGQLTLTPQSRVPNSALTSARFGHKLVYVEDHPANIAFMQELLSELAHIELLSAPNAELGVELIRAHRPSAVILDINLPGMSGFDALRLLRSWPETRDIPVIALSAAAMERDIQRGQEAGFFRYLTKPIKVDELIGVLEELLLGSSPQPETTDE